MCTQTWRAERARRSAGELEVRLLARGALFLADPLASVVEVAHLPGAGETVKSFSSPTQPDKTLAGKIESHLNVLKIRPT